MASKVTVKDNESNEKNNKHLSEDKKNVKKKDIVPFLQLFRFATKTDVLMMLIGSAASIANGCIMPVFMVVFTSIIDSFSSFGSSLCSPSSSTNLTSLNQTVNISLVLPKLPDLTGQLRTQSYYLIGLALLTMTLNYFQIAFWLMPAEKQTKKIRKALFESILKQDIGWFDVYKSGELTNRLSDDINKIKEGISDKFGNGVGYFATFIAGVTIGLIRGWKLTLVILGISPLLFITAAAFTKLTGLLSTNELESYAKAGAVAEEVFTAIRTVFAFNGSKKEHARYEVKLEDAKRFGIKKSIINGSMIGFLWLVINSAYALGFWYGWTLTRNLDSNGQPEYTVGKILLVFFSIIIGVFSLGNAGPFIGTLATARAAAYEVFQIIDRKPPIDSSSKSGEKLDNLIGNIEFINIKFNYPARNDIKILNDVNFKIKTGTSVALVGSSGCGKSTCIQLIQRFYDPLEGVVKIDDIDIKKMNVNWLRHQLGVVNQEPILFSTTIAENIKFGKKDATEDEIITAAKNANAHDFIMELPSKYETLVGDRGGQLSGGQKQRIAIARALVRNPKILLLDEATSALDNESESIVQAALDKARLGRTTIIIAHRLSTIRNVDLIYAFDKGEVVEFGTHDELMTKKGIYSNLVLSQQQSTMNDEDVNEVKSDIVEEKDMKSYLTSNKKFDSLDKKDSIKDEKIEENKKDVSMTRILAMNKPEWYFILIGCVASIISGAVQPAFSIVFSKVIALFQECDINKQRNSINLYCLLFVMFGIITFLSNLIQSSMFGFSGENLTKRLRSLCFKTILKQEIGYFDDQNNNVGKLCTRLAVEAAAVQGATGIRIGVFLMNIGNLGVGLILALAYGWPIALTIFAFLPLMVIGGILQTKMLTGFSSKDKEILEDAGKITNEAISNVRTVAIFGKEDFFLNNYQNKIEIPFKASMKSAHIFGIMLGFTTSITFYAMAASFSLGGYLVENKIFGMTFENVMLVFNCIIFGAQSVGQAAQLLPDYSKAQAAAFSILELFDRETKINNWDTTESGDKIANNDGEITFKQIEFTYPTRPNAPILKKLDLTIKKGQRIALVGSSGCGKSTVTQLLERFYDPSSGQISLCNKNIQELNLDWLRSQIGIVSQEPILFDLSIKENISYGDNSRSVSLEECIEAAKKANIHDFISKLPMAYETNVGSKGTQLSGGQKQRIAIARALVRDPKILLLDEATSALDTESEKIVQDALDKAQMGRTCIIIAHRLSTIRNADMIFVLKHGQVTEAGSHEELIKLNGFYAKLNGQQKT